MELNLHPPYSLFVIDLYEYFGHSTSNLGVHSYYSDFPTIVY